MSRLPHASIAESMIDVDLVDFRDFALQGPWPQWLDPQCIPAHLRKIHAPGLLSSLDRCLQNAVSRPVKYVQAASGRWVSILGGSAFFKRDPDGDLQCQILAYADNASPYLDEADTATIAIDGLPYKNLWLRTFATGAARCLMQDHPKEASLCQEWAAWAIQQVEVRWWTTAQQVLVRARIAAALELNPEVLAVARQLYAKLNDTPLRLADYNRCLRRFELDQRFLQEAPQLVPLHRLINATLPDTGERTQVMRAYLVEECIEAPLWRMLHNHGSTWMLEYVGYFRSDVAPEDIALDVLRLAGAFTFDEHFPVVHPLLRALMNVGGNPNKPGSCYTYRLLDLYGLAERVGSAYKQGDADTRQLILDNAENLFNGWGTTHWGDLREYVQRRISLKGLLRIMQTKFEKDRIQAMSMRDWKMPELHFEYEGVTAVILRTALEVWEEGQRMRHCATAYIDRCANGDYVIVSFRDGKHSRPLATAGYVLAQDYAELDAVTGFANTKVTKEILAIAQACEAQLTRGSQGCQ